MSVPEQMPYACLILFRNQLKATGLVTCIRRVERMKNEVYGVWRRLCKPKKQSPLCSCEW